MRSLFRRIKTKVGLMYVIIFLTLVVLGLSYGAFIYFTDGFKVSDLMISNLMYSIEIVEDGSTSEIENNKVIIPGNTKSYYTIIIRSVNPITSKYTLAYKSNNTLTVEYTDRTIWPTSGELKGYDTDVYSAKVKVVIDNTSNSSSSEVTFNAFGGYTYNSYNTIELKDGYYALNGPYKETISSTNEIVKVVEKEIVCDALSNNICLYDGEVSTNYFQYPTDDDVSKNIWRIIGTYNIDGNKAVKIISTTNTNTTSNALTSDLTTFYNTISDVEEHIEKTNKFNCNSNGCNESIFNNIGILSKYEYDKIGGNNSYLNKYIPFYVLDNNSNIVSINNSESNYLGSIIYLNSSTKVSGSGTSTDPYRIKEGSDINLLAYTLDGEATDKSYEWLKQNTVVNTITCENGTKATWDSANSRVNFDGVQIPDYCVVDFTKLPTLVDTMLKDNPTISERTSFSSTNVANTTKTLYKTNKTEDGSYVYYYSGNTTNNWVKFGKVIKYRGYINGVASSAQNSLFETLKDCFRSRNSDSYTYSDCKEEISDIYWRIIRTNEDGSVRLLYAGTSPDTTTGYIVYEQSFNRSYENALYAGYMYGTTGSLANNRTNTNDSAMKITIDSWYENNLLTNYDRFLSKTAIYCNDRSIGSGTYANNPYFGSYTRLNNSTPTYKCGGNGSGGLFESTQAIEDKFSASTSGGGNGQLKYPIALMTVDEVIFAGGSNGKSLSSPYAYYYTNSAGGSITGTKIWWTMSPEKFEYNSSITGHIIYGSSLPGKFAYNYVHFKYAVRPVISLSSCVGIKSGDGTSTSPYEIDERSCS